MSYYKIFIHFVIHFLKIRHLFSHCSATDIHSSRHRTAFFVITVIIGSGNGSFLREQVFSAYLMVGKTLLIIEIMGY